MTDFQKKLIAVAEMNEATRGIVTEEKSKLLMEFTSHLLEVNKTLNLTAIRDEDGFILKHIVDSLAIGPYIKDGARVADIGCGGGFPTFPIAFTKNGVSVFSVDSVGKKVEHVKSTASLFGLDNIDVSSRRAEELGRDKAYRECFDVACARAVGRLNLLCELCIPLVKVGGCFIAMKSKTTAEELDEAKNAITILGGKLKDVINYTLTDGNEVLERTLVIIEKQTRTPEKYPRNNSQISKKPL